MFGVACLESTTLMTSKEVVSIQFRIASSFGGKLIGD